MDEPSAGTNRADVPVIGKHPRVVARKLPKEWLVAIGLLLSLSATPATESWREVLNRMPLQEGTHELNHTNCVEVMLKAFQSNMVVKALIFMPGATDEFFLYRRAQAQITNASPSLLQAVDALTAQTRIQATFCSPLLLLHTDADRLEPKVAIQDEPTADKIRKTRMVPHVLCTDSSWDYLQPILRWWIRLDIRPWRNSTDSWHFYRQNFAGWGLNGWEGLEAAALAGKTKFTVKHNAVVFELDGR